MNFLFVFKRKWNWLKEDHHAYIVNGEQRSPLVGKFSEREREKREKERERDCLILWTIVANCTIEVKYSKQYL